jgi:hypothetical protein
VVTRAGGGISRDDQRPTARRRDLIGRAGQPGLVAGQQRDVRPGAANAWAQVRP